MNIRSLELENFATYKTLKYEPDNGLTLIVGTNGAGKSTLIEGVCWTLYGETIRGSSPGENVRGEIVIQTPHHDIQVERIRRGGKTKLSVMIGGGSATKQTATETQAVIVQVLGSWERFKATTVFAREFMARFGAATDKERKSLLEGILGLGRFDIALASCREELKVVSIQEAKEQGRVGALEESRAGLTRTLDGLIEPPRAKPVVIAEMNEVDLKEVARTTSIKKMRIAVDQAERLRQGAERVLGKAQGEEAGHLRRIGEIKKTRIAADALASCPVCLREVDTGCKEFIHQKYTDEIIANEILWTAAQKQVAEAAGEVEELKAEWSALMKRKLELEQDTAGVQRARVLAEELARVNAYEGAREQINKSIEDNAVQLWAAKKNVEGFKERIAVLNEVQIVLGTRGARTLLLGRALRRLEQEANSTLAELGLGIAVEIGGVSQLKSGQEVASISVGVKGAGSGDYRALSSGERARVDLGLLLGLASLLGVGWIAFDEVFDSLDPEGQERVANYLVGLGQKRQVLVISHHEDLQALFPSGRKMRAIKENDESRLVAA